LPISDFNPQSAIGNQQSAFRSPPALPADLGERRLGHVHQAWDCDTMVEPGWSRLHPPFGDLPDAIERNDSARLAGQERPGRNAQSQCAERRRAGPLHADVHEMASGQIVGYATGA
jgi:hypothetical protein